MTKPKRHYRGVTPQIAEEIRRRYFAREATQAALGREYRRSQGSISRIVSGQVWSA